MTPPLGDDSSGAGIDWSAAWTSALEALELDVDEAERLLAAGRVPGESEAGPAAPAPWVPPVLGPLPGGLRARAEAVLARQLRVADDLARAMGSNRRQLEVARRLDSGSGTDRSRPVFVDSQL